MPIRQETHPQRKRSTVSRPQQLPQDALSISGEALNLAVIYNQRRSNAMHEKRASFRRRLRSNDGGVPIPQLGGMSGESDVGNYDGDELPFWDAYDVVNQLYIELGKHKHTLVS